VYNGLHRESHGKNVQGRVGRCPFLLPQSPMWGVWPRKSFVVARKVRTTNTRRKRG
jgi:hypothetical protein